MSHATTPVPPHSKQSVSSSASAAPGPASSTPANARVAAATEMRPRRPNAPPRAHLRERRRRRRRSPRAPRRGRRRARAKRPRKPGLRERDEGRGGQRTSKGAVGSRWRAISYRARAVIVSRRSGRRGRGDSRAPSGLAAARVTARVSRRAGRSPVPAQHAHALEIEDAIFVPRAASAVESGSAPSGRRRRHRRPEHPRPISAPNGRDRSRIQDRRFQAGPNRVSIVPRSIGGLRGEFRSESFTHHHLRRRERRRLAHRATRDARGRGRDDSHGTGDRARPRDVRRGVQQRLAVLRCVDVAKRRAERSTRD